MPGERKEIAAQILHVHGHVRHALRAVHHAYRTDAVRFLSNGLHIIFQPEHVGNLRHGNDLRAFRDLRRDILLREIAVLREINVLERSAPALGHELPRNQIAVMLGNRDDDLIAGSDMMQPVAVSDEIQRLRRVFRKDDFLRPRHPDKLCRAGARRFINVRRLDRQGIRAAVRIGVASAVIPADGLDHLLRLLRGRAVVQISDRFVLHLPVQQGKIPEKVLCLSHWKASPSNKHRFHPAALRPGCGPAPAGTTPLPPAAVHRPDPGRGSSNKTACPHPSCRR